MQSFHKFIEINMVPLMFAYGLAYFAAGLAIFLQSRQLSNFRLAHNLWLLGMFGIIHGVAEWGDIFIPVQSPYLSEDWINLLVEVQETAWAVSFAFLLQFGVSMMIPRLRVTTHVKTFLRSFAVVWSTVITLVAIFLLPADMDSSLVRYALGFPAAALTAAAFLSERRSFTRVHTPSARLNLTLTASAFATYAVLGGLIVPETRLAAPLAWLNYDNVHHATGLPIQFWRMLVGMAIAILVIRTLSIFDHEVRQRLEVAEQEQVVLEDRHRIARDLHDGVVQSIYAAGLQLEAASQSGSTDSLESSQAIRRVVGQLNNVIADIRKYIFQLGSARTGEADFEEYLRNMTEEFTANFGISTRLLIDGAITGLSPGQKQNIVFVTRESLSNVYKHTDASEVEIRLLGANGSYFFIVEDNGQGIDPELSSSKFGGGKGLANMAERAEAMGGDFSIFRANAEGGTIILIRFSRVPGNGKTA